MTNADLTTGIRTRRPRRISKELKKNYDLYLMALPAVVVTFIFVYIPMYGVLMAFVDYSPEKGIMGSPFVGLQFFKQFFENYRFWDLLKNTVGINLYALLVAFPIPIGFALILNQIRRSWVRRSVQTITYMPHFISPVVIAGMLIMFLSPSTGLYGHFLDLFGLSATHPLNEPQLFSSIYVWSDVWQHTGWDAIIYISALAAVDVELYNAAMVDGANRWQRVRYIDIPCLVPTMITMLILRIGGLMNVGFDKIYLLQNGLNLTASEVYSTFIYKQGVLGGKFSYTTAIGLFNTAINFVLLISVNKLCKRFTKTGLW